MTDEKATDKHWPLWTAGYQAGMKAQREKDADPIDVLQRHGFVRCDIPACNCGSWHPRYGVHERFQEVKNALEAAGYLGNYNGNLVLAGLLEVIEKAGVRSQEPKRKEK